MKRRSQLQLPEANINLTSLLDITFTLLISFMVVAPAVKYSVDLELPKVSESQSLDDKKPVRVQVGLSKSGETVYYLNGKGITLGLIPESVRTEPDYSADLGVALEADKGVPWEAMARLMTILRDNDINNIGIVTEQGG